MFDELNPWRGVAVLEPLRSSKFQGCMSTDHHASGLRTEWPESRLLTWFFRCTASIHRLWTASHPCCMSRTRTVGEPCVRGAIHGRVRCVHDALAMFQNYAQRVRVSKHVFTAGEDACAIKIPLGQASVVRGC